jgi:ribonuclease III
MTLEEKLGYFFFDKRQLARALTRKAYAVENPPSEDQEAYGLLGGAVLDTVLTELLIRAGYTTQQAIVSQKLALKQMENLAKISETVGIGYVVKLGAQEKEQRAYERPEVLVETLEAAIAAIYFDGGFSAARRTIQGLFKDVFTEES